MVFASVIDVLQDQSFTIATADPNVGLIIAESPTTNSTNSLGDVFWGGSSGTMRVSVLIETLADGRTRVKLSYISRKRFPRSLINKGQYDTVVSDPGFYQLTFQRIGEALFVRKATDKPTSVSR
jgi:hypothetical protein